jgi:hypothetical protein
MIAVGMHCSPQPLSPSILKVLAGSLGHSLDKIAPSGALILKEEDFQPELNRFRSLPIEQSIFLDLSWALRTRAIQVSLP